MVAEAVGGVAIQLGGGSKDRLNPLDPGPLAMVTTCASAWLEAAISAPDGGQRWVIYDEAWRLTRQPALLARMQSQWKLSRGLGSANPLIVQPLAGLDAVVDAGSESRALARGLLGHCSTTEAELSLFDADIRMHL